jgi:hypothetical protein
MMTATSISSHHRDKQNHFSLAAYDSEHFGPLFAVSDEGSAGEKGVKPYKATEDNLSGGESFTSSHWNHA